MSNEDTKHPSKTDGLKTGLLSSASRFVRSERGAIAPWFAIMLVPMLGFTYGALKFTELSEQRTNMRDAMDASALAMARWIDINKKDPCLLASPATASQRADRDEMLRFAREYFAQNYPQHDTLFADAELTKAWNPATDLQFRTSCNSIVADTEAFTDMGGILGSYFGVGSVPLGVGAEITLAGSGKVEIALVVDVSGSMDNTDLKNLKTAVEGMAEGLYGDAENEFVKVGVVPFNSIVNVGATLANANMDWFDTTAESIWHGANFIDARIDPYKSTDAQKLVLDSKRVNHFTLFKSTPGLDWAGCVESRPFPLDEWPSEPGSSMSSTAYTNARTRPTATTPGRPFEVNPSASADVKTRMNQAWADVPDMPSGFQTALNTSAASRYVPWFYPDEADCEGLPSEKWCRTNSSRTRYKKDGKWEYTDEHGKKWRDNSGSKKKKKIWDVDGDKPFPAWAAAYGDVSELTDAPRQDKQSGKPSVPRYAMRRIENAGFVRDVRYADVRDTKGFHTNSRADYGKWYLHYLLDARNAWAKEHPGAPADACGVTDDMRKFYGGSSWPDAGNDTDEIYRAMRDRLKITDSNRCASHEFRLRQAYVGVWDPTKGVYRGKYDLYEKSKSFRYNQDWAHQSTSSDQGRNANFRCGAPLLPLTTKKKELVDYVNGLSSGGGTNSAIGLMWGWHMLTPKAPLQGAADLATPSGKKWRKFAILMSDGQNNLNDRNAPFATTRAAYGYGSEDRLNIVSQNDPNGSQVTSRYDAEIDHKTIRICHKMQAEGIKVFTVGYGLNQEEAKGRYDRVKSIEAMLKACANSAEGTSIVDANGNPTGVTYIRADNANALQKAFEDIADAIEELHVSG